MPICIEWRRLGFGGSLMIQEICQNWLNPQVTWGFDSSASAALALASLRILYTL